jgi:biopolymer transport protein ExbD
MATRCSRDALTMKIKSRVPNKVELNMTPMIDIVFQLLIFFIMSFKIAAQEGDFLSLIHI